MIAINLFDYNFGQSDTSYSVAYQTPDNVRYVRGLMRYDGITLFTDEYINNPVVDQVESRYKVGWLHEPSCLHPFTYEHALFNAHKFDFIMTNLKPFLRESPAHFRYSPYGGVWVDRSDWNVYPKGEMISMLFGAKNTTSGHRIRHQIYDHIKDKKPHVQFYGLYGIPTDYGQHTKLNVLKNYQFSIVAETCREDGLFTEILLDCFALGTIPIFWGAPDIGKFFDERGIISFVTVNDMDTILPLLSAKLYQKMLPYARINLGLVANYACTEDWHYRHYYKEMI